MQRKFVAALGAYLFATYFMSLINCFADLRAQSMPPEIRHKALPDVGFDLVPKNREILWVLDILTNSQAVLLMVSILLQSRRRIELVVRFMGLHTFLLLLRSATIASTSMPSPHECTNILDGTGTHILLAPLRHLARRDAMMSWCHDFMFSGHSAFLLLAALFIREIKASPVIVFLAASMVPVAAVILISTRSHYSSDIIVAWIITACVYCCERNWTESPLRVHQALPFRQKQSN